MSHKLILFHHPSSFQSHNKSFPVKKIHYYQIVNIDEMLHENPATVCMWFFIRQLVNMEVMRRTSYPVAYEKWFARKFEFQDRGSVHEHTVKALTFNSQRRPDAPNEQIILFILMSSDPLISDLVSSDLLGSPHGSISQSRESDGMRSQSIRSAGRRSKVRGSESRESVVIRVRDLRVRDLRV